MTLEKKARERIEDLKDIKERIDSGGDRIEIAREYSHTAEYLGVGMLGLLHLAEYFF